MIISNANPFSSSKLESSNLWSLALSQLLLLQQNQDTYALVLSKARQESLTPYLASILQKLTYKQGDKWLQVVRRLVSNNYRQGFQSSRSIDIFLPPLIEQYYIQARGRQNEQIYARQIWNIIQKCIKSYNDRNQEYKLTVITNLQCYIQSALNHTDIQIQQQIFLFLSQNSITLDSMLSQMNLNNYQNQLQVYTQHNYNNRNNNHHIINSKLWKLHHLSILLFLSVIKLVEKMEDIAVRKINVRKFRELLGLNDSFREEHSLGRQEIGIYVIIQKYLKIVLTFISTLNQKPTNSIPHQFNNNNIMLNTRLNLFSINNNSFPYSPISSFLKFQTQPTITNYYTSLFQILYHFTKIFALEPILSRNTCLLDFVTQIIKNINIVQINKYHDIDKQIIALNSQVIHQLFSDTLAGTLLRTIVSLSTNIGPFFHYYFSSLNTQYKNGQISRMQPTQFASYLLKINLLSYPDLISYHQQQIQQLILLLAQLFLQLWKTFPQIQQVQILRFFMLFVGIDLSNPLQQNKQNISHKNKTITKGLGITKSTQQLVEKCINLCFEFISTNNQLSSYEDLSTIQHQCLDILHSLPKYPNTLNIIKSSLLPTLLNLFMNLPNYSLIYLQLVNQYIKAIPQLVQRSSTTLIDYYHNAFITIKNQLNKTNHRTADLQKIYKILHNIQAILQTDAQIGFDDIQDKIVVAILSNLQDLKQFDYQQELLSILQVLLTKHHHFTYQICLILSKLPHLYQKNKKKLSTFRNLYLALSTSSSIANQITYQYPDIIVIMLQLFLDYLTNTFTINQFTFYKQQLTDLFWNIQIFIQVYTIKIIQDNSILALIQKIFYNLQPKITQLQKTFCKSNFIDILDTCNSQNSQSCPNILFQLYEILLQYLMTISHICVDPRAFNFNQIILSKTLQIINQTPIINYNYLQTIKMVPIILIDQLLINASNHEQVMKDILSYCEGVIKLQIEYGIQKKWQKIQNFSQWRQWPFQTRVYIENVLKQLKNKKQIDQVDYVEYLKILQKIM